VSNTKRIDTLSEDIYEVLTSGEDNSLPVEDLVDYAHNLSEALQTELRGKRRARKERVLYASEIGKPCTRQTAYAIDSHAPHDPRYTPEPLAGHTKIKFQYGHMVEELVLYLAKAAGHSVTHQQEVYEKEYSNGWVVRGRCDAIIDGVMVDVKSASTFMFNRYKREGIDGGNDGFGYRAQVEWYRRREGLKNNPALLMVDKQNGHVNVVPVDTTLMENPDDTVEKKVEQLENFVLKDELPPRLETYEVPEGKSGNKKLCTTCSYCPFKKDCHPNLRAFKYSNGPVFLTNVSKEPKVPEIPL